MVGVLKGVDVAKAVAFPPDFRAEAVRMFRASGRSLTSVARELNISVESLSRWTKQAEIDEGRAEGLTSEERDELRRLRRENKILLEEKEILRKPALLSPGRPITADEIPADRRREVTPHDLPQRLL